jgi:predicted RNA methylase
MASRIQYNNPDRDGVLGLPYHYELLADRCRMAPFRRAIARVARGRRVLESGTGSGILSILAARAGARAVYAVERDPQVARFARRNFRAAGCDGVIRLIENDVRQVRLADIDDEPVDLVIAENLSTWQVTEPQVSVMNHINRRLAVGSAVRLPLYSFNYVELVCSRYRFEDAVEMRTHYFGFSGIPRPVALSEPALFRTMNFARINDTVIEDRLPVLARRAGVVNGLRLTSPIQVHGNIRFTSSDSLMPPVVVPLAEDLEVSEGDWVAVSIQYRCESEWQDFRCQAQPAAALEIPAALAGD